MNPASRDRANALDVGAIQFALLIRSLLDGEITVLHAWHRPAEKKIHVYLSGAEAESAMRATETRAGEDLARLVNSFGQSLAGCRIELKRGAEEKIIPAFVVSEGIDIVITGAQPETGIWRLLFKSTAEELLKATPCSVVAFKLQHSGPERVRSGVLQDAP